jgi:hypothetical protein
MMVHVRRIAVMRNAYSILVRIPEKINCYWNKGLLGILK